MMCFNILHGIHVREIGLQLTGQVRAPFLKMGATRAFFQSAGIIRCFKVAWYISVSMGATLLAVSLSRRGKIPFGPHAL